MSQEHTVHTNGQYGNLATFTSTHTCAQACMHTHTHTQNVHILCTLKKPLSFEWTE